MVEEVLQDFAKCAIDKNAPIITEALIQQSRDTLPQDVVDKIFSLDILTLSTILYHELPTRYKNALGVLIDARIKDQQGMSDIENTKVFKHIDNPLERYKKAMQARVLLKHLPELSELLKMETRR